MNLDEEGQVAVSEFMAGCAGGLGAIAFLLFLIM